MSAAESQSRSAPAPRRWTTHLLNTGVIFGTALFLVRRLPRRVSYAIGHVVCWVAWRLMPATNDAVADNLSAVFPAESAARRRRRALDVYRAYALDAVDFFRSIDTPAERALETFEVSPEAVQWFRTLLDEGRGVILVTCHYGNWEMGALVLRGLDLPLTVVAMAEASPAVNRLRHQIRERIGVSTIEVRQSFDTALRLRRALAENRLVALLVDRHLDRDRVPVTLLGRRAWFLKTPALMASMSGAPMLPCFIERTGPGRFRVSTLDPIRVPRDGDRDAHIRDAAQQLADALDARIRHRPELWYHFYRYWDAQRDEYGELL